MPMDRLNHPQGFSTTEDRSPIKRIVAVLFMIGLYYVIQLLTLVFAIYPHLRLPDDLQARGSWVQVLDHHVWQMLFALVAIGLLSRGRWHDWGLNLRNRAESLRLLRQFCYYYGVYFIGIGFLVQLLFFPPPVLDHPMTATHIIGRLAFGFLFVGLSEEILFRGLIHSYLARYWAGVWTWQGWQVPVAGVVSALIFTLAHINFRLAPFEITHFAPLQLVQAFILGLYYAAVYHRTRSLLTPILAHNFSNGTLWVQEYVLVWIKA